MIIDGANPLPKCRPCKLSTLNKSKKYMGRKE
jgi:hypothetical protein